MRMKLIISTIILCTYSIVNAENYAKEAIEAKNHKKWQDAFNLADLSTNATIKKLITFQYYITPSNNASFKEITAFIQANPSWPNINNFDNPNWPEFTLGLKIAAEKALRDKDFDAKEVSLWFDKNKPQTAKGYKYYLKALGGDVKNHLDLIEDAWVNSDFNEKDEKEFLQAYGAYLDQDTHMDKVEKLLWNKNVASATPLLRFLNKSNKSIAQATIAFLNKNDHAKKLYHSLPEELKLNSLILYSYLSADIKSDQFNPDTLKLIFKTPVDTENARKWWLLKSIYVRYFLQHKNFKNAYKLAATSYANDSLSLCESEFLAGWISLTKLNNPTLALAHFSKIHQKVSKSISLSRAAYWIARCYQKKSNNKLASDWFRKAAKFNYTFYGQLALTELNQPRLSFHNAGVKTNYDDELFNALKLLVKYDKSSMPALFAIHIINSTQDVNRITSAVELIKECKKTDLLIAVAREAASKNVFMLDCAFPKPFDITKPLVDKTLIYAIIRQESSFKQDVEINQDGIMQVEPPTAKRVSAYLNIEFNPTKIKNDFDHNIKIGSGYLKILSNYYKGSYTLLIPAYNAGENAVNKWIKRYSDPRHTKDIHKIVDWLENIPYFITRNYAQRVLENIQMYKYILGDKNLSIKKDLLRLTQ